MKRYFNTFSLFFVGALMFSAAFASDSEADEQPVIVELFTSQGCPACPPASSLISRIAKENGNIEAFIWAVDYWDYLGWTDSMAIEASSQRQENFNRNMDRKGVFTPQVVINGSVQTIGSREGDIRSLIKEQADNQLERLELSFEGNSENLSINIPGPQNAPSAIVSLIWFKDEETIRITSGDNRGQLFHYVNVVRGLHEYGTIGELSLNDLSEASVPIQLQDFNLLDANCLAVLVQDKVGGKIIGFTKITFPELEARS